MKIYVTKEDEKKIENFQNISLRNFDNQIKDVVANSCTTIVADEVVDFLSNEDANKLLNALCAKLRKNGELVVTGVDLGVVSRNVISGVINEDQYSSIIAYRGSLHFSHSIVGFLKTLNLTIETCKIEGIKYDITAKR